MELCSQVGDFFVQISEHSSSFHTRPYLNNPVYKNGRVLWNELS
jgi:hypothetical protein